MIDSSATPAEFKMNVLTLSFQENLEGAFQEEYSQKSLRHVQVALIVAIFFYGIFGILDAWIAPGDKHKLWFIRYAIFCPYVLSIFLFSFSKRFIKYMQCLVASMIIIAGLGIIAMILIAPNPGNYSYYAGLILVFLYGYTFSKLRFVWATLAGWMIVIGYEIAAVALSHTPIPILINNNFFFLSGNIIGMFACYSIELYSRKEFMQTRLLEAEREKVDSANRELEKRVEQRTAQLVKANKELKEEISEHKRTQEELKKSEEKYRTILENIEEGYYEVDLAGNFTFFNDSIQKILGYDRNELRGMNNRQYTDQENGKKLYQAFNKVYTTGRATKEFDWQIIRKDGSERYVEASVSVLKDSEGEPIGFRGIVRDITERKEAEEALRESKEKYRLLVDYAHDGIFIAQSGLIKFQNPKAQEIFGCSTHELLETPFIDLVHPEDRRFLPKGEERRPKGEDIPSTYSLRIINKSGEELWVQINAVDIKWEGKPATLSFVSDITFEKRLEAQLLQAQKMEAIGTLAGGIAHDFNNILSSVIGYTELAIEEVSKGGLLHNNLQEVLKAGRRARDLVRQILAFSRQSDQELKPLEISPIIKETLKLLRASLPSTIDIKQHIGANMGTVMTDPTHVNQILMNLCTNAAHAMGENGGILDVSLEKVRNGTDVGVRFAGLSSGPYLKLTVSDNGYGMTPEVRERIFDPYFTTKEKGEGTGLGLAMVHGIVKSHGGTITVYSEPEMGSTFHVYLPIMETETDQDTGTEETVPTGSERILFVDDEQPIADIAKQMVEQLGYTVVTKTSSLEALELFRAKPDEFDLVITDMTMPSMTGEELANELMFIRPDIPIILCTGFSRRVTEKKAKAMGIQAFILKPILRQELAETIRRVLDETR
ncbi:MAG: PAS domain S-box protein [Desulfobacteraceae bacterium]|jgi:PAS domain S-box-containing protein